MRLIDADWVFEHTKPYELSDEDWNVTGGTAIRLIHTAVDQAPTIDAAQVVHAQWEEADWREYNAQSGEAICYPNAAIACTNCLCAFKKDALWSRNYCPGCGAKMDGGTEK